ncbi:MAG: ATP-binding cassette domain-containing protein, partial [Brevinematia bacterium]
MILLKVECITKYFGGIKAVNDVSFDVEKGKVVSIIGPNGAGKGTLLKVINGVL